MPDPTVTVLAELPAESAHPEGGQAESELVEEEILVEEISIDGMCGVY